MRSKNKLLPTPAVPVIVPDLLTIVPATNPKSTFCVSDTGAGTPIIVILEPPLVRLILAPATSVVCDGPEIVRLCAPAPTLTPPAPDTLRSPEYVPLELEVVFPRAVIETVPAAAAGAEMETVPFPTPTLTTPIPEKAKTLFIVPDDVAPVVLPEADNEIVENAAPAAGTDILTVPLPAPTLAAPIPENASTLLNVPDDVAPVVLPEADIETVENEAGPTTVMELAPVFRVILFPATNTILPADNAPAVPIAVTTGTVGIAVFSPIVILIFPAAVAVVKFTFTPGSRSRDTAVPVTDVPLALIDCVAAPAVAAAEIVMAFAPV